MKVDTREISCLYIEYLLRYEFRSAVRFRFRFRFKIMSITAMPRYESHMKELAWCKECDEEDEGSCDSENGQDAVKGQAGVSEARQQCICGIVRVLIGQLLYRIHHPLRQHRVSDALSSLNDCLWTWTKFVRFNEMCRSWRHLIIMTSAHSRIHYPCAHITPWKCSIHRAYMLTWLSHILPICVMIRSAIADVIFHRADQVVSR